jgi:hypothetical protein
MKLSNREIALLARLAKNKKMAVVVNTIDRKSDREFDLVLNGVYLLEADPTRRLDFADYPLLLIAIEVLLDWTKSKVANMTDYPDMAKEGDWSGVRDTDINNLWLIFDEFITPKVKA